VLRSGPLASKSYEALDAELARQNLGRAAQAALRGERAFGLQRFREMSDDWRVGYMKMPSGKNDECAYLELMDELIREAPLPYSKRLGHNSDANALANRAGPLTQLIIPATRAMSVASARAEATNHCLRILCALARREAAGNSGEPKLADLGLPPEATIDPFNGEPLRIKQLPDGWLVYSVGHDMKDDGGSLADLDDTGLGPPSAEKMSAEKPSTKKEDKPTEPAANKAS
jgi:hypothetical protein